MKLQLLMCLCTVLLIAGCSDSSSTDVVETPPPVEGDDNSGDDNSGDDNSGDDNSGGDSSGGDSSDQTDQGSTENNTMVAKLTDNMTNDAGELRYKLEPNALESGRLSVRFYKESNTATADGTSKDAYIGIYGESTSTDNALIDLRLRQNSYEIRNHSTDIDVPLLTDQWNQVEISWDATNASSSQAPLFSLSINGVLLTESKLTSATKSKSDVVTGARYIIFKLGDNASTLPNVAYYVDDIEIYSDEAGIALVFEDDFEQYEQGFDLANDASPYYSKTAAAETFLFNGSDDNGDDDSNDNGDNHTPVTLSCNASYPLNVVQISDHNGENNSADLLKIIDNNKTNTSNWITSGLDSQLIFELEDTAKVQDLVISWGNNSVSYNFDVDTSLDGETWFSNLTSQQSEIEYLIADRVSLSSSSQEAKFIRLQLKGNNVDDRSNLIEVELFGCNQEASHEIELIDWYLSVQTDVDGNGKSDSISEQSLAAGYEDPRFFYVNKDSGLVFSSTVEGYRTSTNTKYVRSELREMLRKGNTSHKTQGVNLNNWVFSSAPQADLDAAGGIDGTLDVDVAVNYVTSTGEDYQIGRVIIGQIHANDDEPVRLYYRKLPDNELGSIYIAHEYLDGDDNYYEIIGSRDNSADNPSDGIALDERFSYQIKVEGNQLTVTITKQNGDTYSQIVDMSNSGYDEGGQYMYFKAGVYNQNNSGHLHDYVQATFFKIDNQHD